MLMHRSSPPLGPFSFSPSIAGLALLSVAIAGAFSCSHAGSAEPDEPVSAREVTQEQAFEAHDEPPEDLSRRQGGHHWPIFLGPNRDGKSPERGILTDWSGDKLRLVWKRALEESYGIGSLSQGRFVQLDRVGDELVIDCLNAETGERIWRQTAPTEYEDLYGYNGGPRCSPVIDGNRVYVYSVDGRLLCLQFANGEILWQVETNDRYGVVQNFFGVGSTPVIFNDLLIVMVGGSDPEFQAIPPGRLDRVVGNGSCFVAFDKRTGEEKYRTGDDLASYASLQLANINDQDWCFGFARESLIGFSPQDGTIRFEYPWRARMLESVNASTPIVIDDQVLISETYGPGSALLKIAGGSFEEVWKDSPAAREKKLQTHWNTPIHHEGFVYGSSGRHEWNADLRCVELATGEVKWRRSGLSRSSLLFIDDHFIVLTESGNLVLIEANPDEFKPVTTAFPQHLVEGKLEPLLKPPAWAAPLVVNGLLYARGDDYLACFDLIPE